MMLVRISGYSRSDRRTQSAPYDGTLATTHFITDDCTGCTSNSAAYRRIHG
jgi:hypothetical protein